MRSHIIAIGCITVFTNGVLGLDENDWVDPSYVLQSGSNSGTSSARNTITSGAGSTAKDGPWTVSTSTSIRAPSNDPRDYLSWAPYHWPNCDWCGTIAAGSKHIAKGSNGTDSSQSPTDDPGPGDGDDDGYDDGEDDGEDDSGDDDGDDDGSGQSDGGNGDSSSSSTSGGLPIAVPPISRMRKLLRRRDFFSEASFGNSDLIDTTNLPTSVNLPGLVSQTTSSDKIANGTPAANENPVKTEKGKATTTTVKNNAEATKKSETETTKGAADCIPSPTKSLAPSATWTTCPYVVRDGQLNPDVRMLNGINAVNGVTQSVIYNALAYAFTKSSTYSKNVASFINTFFLDSKVGVHPELNYGQTIRGPGSQQGQFLGILDFRGMVKVINGIQIVKAAKSPDWTSTLDGQMMTWVGQYLNWLQTDDLATQASTAPNNHGSFYYNQLSALKINQGDTNGATAALNYYFTHQFLDQIAVSGEQPFEAVRTRPYHYRCFNLEAMITNAKIGNQLGLNLWTSKSKYGATIQTALDYTMGLNPGSEDVSDIFPHVAAVAAAYGDPSGKYANFLKAMDSGYTSTPFWYYDQTTALANSPAAAKGAMKMKRDNLTLADDPDSDSAGEDSTTTTTSENSKQTELHDIENGLVPTPTAASDIPTPTIPFECPAAFATATEVELDDGIYVTCDELKPLYGYVDEVQSGISSASS